jgi:hypothetical protein
MLDDVADSSASNTLAPSQSTLGRAVPRLRPAVFVPVENDAGD